MILKVKHNGKWVSQSVVASSIEIDKTLTKEGAAADAKAVGDKIGDVDSILDAINGEVV